MKQLAHVDGVMRGDTQKAEDDNSQHADDERLLLIGLTSDGDPA